MVQLIWPIIAVGWVVNLFQRGTASVVRIDELLKQQPSIADAPAATDAPITGDIEFRNLTFAYPDAPPSSTTSTSTSPPAPASPSSAPPAPANPPSSPSSPACTTPPPERSSSTASPSATTRWLTLRKSIGFVPQETFLFSDTIRQNIAFGRPDASPEQVEEAATIAHICTEILEFPKGFDTKVGERGLTLSGGQKQRTAIARAIIRDPSILILDDALASVDTYTEERILSGLKRVMEGRTTIFISHRISTARNADQIAVLVDGRIAELGTHDELIARNGYYTSLFEKQRLEEELSVAT